MKYRRYLQNPIMPGVKRMAVGLDHLYVKHLIYIIKKGLEKEKRKTKNDEICW